jgi:hypothetical protein
MKKFTLVLLILAAAAQVSLAGEFAGTFAEAKAQSATLGKPVLVDFFTEW